MNKQFASLLCLVLLTTMPACRKKRKEEKKQHDEINTLIEIDNNFIEEEIEKKESNAKF